jgi:acyl-CoA synthetase (AMP-forming)/AMP-acid ligase II
MLSHANMLAAVNMTNAYLANTADDVVVNVLPLAHSYGLYQPFDIFQAGGRLVLERNFAFPADVIQVLRREHATAFPGSPTIFALLLKYRSLLEPPLMSLRYLTNAASELVPARIQELRAVFPNVQIISMYGQTECKRISYLPAEELDRRSSSVGVAIPNSEVFIVDEHGKEVEAGEVGELVVRGAHVARGYWQLPELTAEKFRPGPLPGETVLHTGDLFRMDEAGYLYFVARKDDIIKSRGEKIAPLEIERAACALDGVSEAAVVGVPDAVLGQAVLLMVTPQPNAHLTERAIRAHCACTLDNYLQPTYVAIAADLPRTDNTKVDKRQIVAEFQPGARVVLQSKR